jgi:hypothetical protein
MNRTTVLSAALAIVALCCPVHGEYGVHDKGIWPASWPKELEALRKQARTLEGPMAPDRHYLIPFTKREEFEAAWPHLLKVKSKGAPIVLLRAPKTDFMGINPAGVLIHTPPVDANTGKTVGGDQTSYIELVVDGNIVDLNRIALPADTPIVDKRFTGPAATAKDGERGGQTTPTKGESR